MSLRKVTKNLFSSHLYGNGLWLIADNIMLSGFGFLFWLICTKLFTVSQIGIASTFIASIELLTAFSILGLNVSFIRYLPRSKEKRLIMDSGFTLAVIAGIVSSFVFILFASQSQNFSALQTTSFKIFFMLFVVFSIIFQLVDVVFMSRRQAKFVFSLNFTFSIIKVLLPFFFITLGAFGIISSWMIGIIVATFFGLTVAKYIPLPRISKSIIKKMIKFSGANYVANLFSIAPSLLFPILITYILKPESTAYFYMAWMIATVLFVVPNAFAKSLLIEGSHDEEDLSANVKKVYKISSYILIPSVIIIILLAKYLLLFFGQNYSSNATTLLQLLALSSIPMMITTVAITIFNVEHKILSVVGIQGFIAIVSILLSMWLLPFGIIMVGWIWLCTQIAAALLTLPWVIKKI